MEGSYWVPCDGRALSKSKYSALFNLIGSTFSNGDYNTEFNIPDLRGRTVIGSGQGNDLTFRTFWEMEGEELHTLTIAELASHSHYSHSQQRIYYGNAYSFNYINEVGSTYDWATSRG